MLCQYSLYSIILCKSSKHQSLLIINEIWRIIYDGHWQYQHFSSNPYFYRISINCIVTAVTRKWTIVNFITFVIFLKECISYHFFFPTFFPISFLLIYYTALFFFWLSTMRQKDSSLCLKVPLLLCCLFHSVWTIFLISETLLIATVRAL